jgi:hypothetical protein
LYQIGRDLIDYYNRRKQLQLLREQYLLQQLEALQHHHSFAPWYIQNWTDGGGNTGWALFCVSCQEWVKMNKNLVHEEMSKWQTIEQCYPDSSRALHFYSLED